MKACAVLTTLLAIFIAYSCKTTEYSKVKHAGEKLKVCGEGEKDDRLSTTATDFNYEDARRVATEKFFDDRGIPSDLRAGIPLEQIDVCGNDINQSYTVRMGLRHDKLMTQYEKTKEAHIEAMDVIDGREDDLDPEEFRLLAKAASYVQTWEKLRNALMRRVVSLPRIDAKAITNVLNIAISHTHVVLKYDGDVDADVRSIYRQGLTSLGFSAVDYKHMTTPPDFVLTVSSRFRRLPSISDQFKYVILTISATVTDSSGIGVGEINWKFKGGGRNIDAAYFNARHNLRKRIDTQLLYSMFSKR